MYSWGAAEHYIDEYSMTMDQMLNMYFKKLVLLIHDQQIWLKHIQFGVIFLEIDIVGIYLSSIIIWHCGFWSVFLEKKSIYTKSVFCYEIKLILQENIHVWYFFCQHRHHAVMHMFLTFSFRLESLIWLCSLIKLMQQMQKCWSW